MSVLTSQQITSFYERYKKTDLIFTKEMIEVTGLIPRHICLKCVEEYTPCFIYSSSFEGAKILIKTNNGIVEKLREANQLGSLKFCFNNPETNSPIAFFVNFRLLGYAPYGGIQDTVIMHTQFLNRPPDDLILIIGQILEADINFSRRRGERIVITNDVQHRLNLVSRELVVSIQGVSRHCILYDLSFYGAKVIIAGSATFLECKEVVLTMEFDDPKKTYVLPGKFIRAETFEERKELLAMAIAFEESSVPLGYKMRISSYINQTRHTGDGVVEIATA